MMQNQYWGLFWGTGMPEAWLMSRERMAQLKDAAGPGPETADADGQTSPPDNVPGGPWGLT